MQPLPEMNFDKCPAYDPELKSWGLMHPGFKQAFFDAGNDPEKLARAMASVKNVIEPADKKGTREIEYGFNEDAIIVIVEHYADSEVNPEEITDLVRESRENEITENQYVNYALRDWKYYEVPAVDKGYYEIRGPGVFRVVETYSEETGDTKKVVKDVCRTPFILCGVSEPLNDDLVFYKVRYANYEGEIKEFWASKSDLLSKKELKTLFLAKGINCPENNLLNETIEYISRSIAEFAPRYKKEFSAKQTGWNKEKDIFVLGDRGITLKGVVEVLSVGEAKGFKELEKKGTFEDWKKGVLPFLDFDLIRFKFYDAFTAPLNAILGIESHITDHYGTTSCGKTFSSWVALSGVGDPEGLTIGAKSSMKGILLTVKDFSDLPILIDESSDAGEHLKDIVYPLTSNKGRVTSTATRERDGGEEYHTSTMFTGERPIRDCLTNAGQQYRVIELNDTLPDLPTKEINRVKQIIRDNHGHLIELFLKKVLEWKETGKLQKRYETCFDKLPEIHSNIEGRSKSIFAGIMLSGYILEQIFAENEIPQKDAGPIVEKYFKACVQENPVELEYMRALSMVLDWVHMEKSKFIACSDSAEDYSNRDRKDVFGFYDNIYIDIIGTAFTEKMKQAGFSPTKIKEDWYKQGIIEVNDKKRKGTYRFTRGGERYPGVRIHRPIAEELLDIRYEEDQKIPEDQDTRIRRVLKIIEFLTDLDGSAKISLIRTLANVPELDDLLKLLCTNSKRLMKINQEEYIFLN